MELIYGAGFWNVCYGPKIIVDNCSVALSQPVVGYYIIGS